MEKTRRQGRWCAKDEDDNVGERGRWCGKDTAGYEIDSGGEAYRNCESVHGVCRLHHSLHPKPRFRSRLP